MSRFPSCMMAACVVPWDDHNAFIEDLFVHQVKHLLKQTPHLYVFGTAGEGYAVDDRRFQQVTRVFHDVMKSAGAESMVGVISLSLPVIQERIEWARDLGVRQFQISLPSWGALDEKELFTFFDQVCGSFPDCRFLHYNLGRTKRLVTPKEYAALAEAHPNLVATKNSTDSMHTLAELARLSPQLRHFVNETGYVFASQLDECGLLASVAAMHPVMGSAFFEAGRRRDVGALLELYAEIAEITRILLSAAGPQAKIDGAYDKMLWRVRDERFPLRLLPPYLGASEDAFRRFADEVRAKFPRWTT